MPRTAPEPLRRLLGPTRAEILLRLATPMTTTQLAAVTGLALGTIGSQLADGHSYKRESSSAFLAANSSSVRTPR